MSADFEDRLRAARHVLPEPSETATAAARDRLIVSFPLTRRDPRRLRIARRTLVIAVAFGVAAGALGFGVGRTVGPSSGSAATATPKFAPGFVSAQGWNTLSTGITKPPQAPTALAANVPFSPKDGESEWVGNEPDNTINSLPPRGIVFVVALYGGQHLRGYEPQTLPLRLTDAAAHPFEGISPRIAWYSIQARINGWNVDAKAFFGASRPTSTQLAEAQQELDRLVLPG